MRELMDFFHIIHSPILKTAPLTQKPLKKDGFWFALLVGNSVKHHHSVNHLCHQRQGSIAPRPVLAWPSSDNF